MGISKGQKAVLHVAKGKLALDDETYRDALEAHGGVRSAKNLDYEGFKAVMRHFEACGFQSDRRRKVTGKDRPGMATAAQIRKIYASWCALGGSYYKKGQELKALRGFLKKRFRVDHENFLKFSQAGTVIEAIKKIGTRAGKHTTEDGRQRIEDGKRTSTSTRGALS